jgi:hypothetical protein
LAEKGSYPLLFGPTKVGPWPNIGGNSNIVPTVSNGLVYVTSSRTLAILSLKGGAPAAAPLAEAAPEAAAAPEAVAPPTAAFEISGTLKSINGSVLTLTNRNGKDRLIDDFEATKNGQIAPTLTVGEAYTAVGASFTSAGVMHADAINRAKCRQHNDAGRDVTGTQPCTGDQWPPDRDPGQ